LSNDSSQRYAWPEAERVTLWDFPGHQEMIARGDLSSRAQCLTAAAINTFSLAEECSNKG
jgi:hypothetical protein